MRHVILASFFATAALAEPVTLARAVSEALANNAALLAVKADIAIADARILTARLRPNPSISIAGDHMDILGSGFNGDNGGGPTEIALGFEYTLERGGKRQRRIEVARQERSVTELQFRNAVRSLTLDVQNAFIDVLLTKESAELARENLGFFRQIVDVNAARVKAGDIAEVELVRSRLAALQYETAVQQSDLKHRQALVKLQTLMGRRRSASTLSADGTLERLDASPLLEDLIKQALEQRPDVLALRRDVRRAESEIALQQADARQDWTLGSDFRRQQVNARSNSLTLSLSVPLPVLNRNQGEIARAREERRQAELKLRAIENELAGDVEAAWSQFTTARGLLQTIRNSMLQHARDVRQITEYSYRRRDATLLELLDAQRAFNDTMQAYIEARAEYARSGHLLDSVSGKELQ